MSIQDLIKTLLYENEEYILEKRISSGKDKLGYNKTEWVEIEKLHGIIQKPSIDPLSERGSEELADYYGFFVPTFKIPQNDLKQYRIKHKITNGQNTFVRYFRIKTIDRDLRLQNNQNHYEMTLELYKKW